MKKNFLSVSAFLHRRDASLCDPSLDPILYVCISLVLGSPEPGTIVAPSLLSGGESSTLDLLAIFSLMQFGTLLASFLFCLKGTFLAHVQLSIYQESQVLFCQLAFQCTSIWWFSSQGAGFALSFLKITIHHLPACL